MLRQASVYARAAKTQPIYVQLAKGTEATSYNLAIADYWGKPQVLDIQAESWTGQIGQTILVKAKDDTLVTRVQVTLRNEDGSIYEQGEAVRSEVDGLLWLYTTTTNLQNTYPLIIEAVACDMPGNRGESSLTLD